MSAISRALVTGASGFLGRHLCRNLLARGCDVTAVARPHGGLLPPDVRGVPCATLDVRQLRAAFVRMRPQVIFHLAGTPRGTGDDLHEANVGYAMRVLEATSEMETPATVVLVGSAAEYGRPIRPDGIVAEEDECRPVSAYGISKLEQTRLGLDAAARGLPVIVARLFNPIGRGSAAESAVGRFVRDVAAMPAAGGTLTTGPVHAVRDFTDVTATASALVELAKRPGARGRIVNVCSGRGVSVGHVVDRLIALAPAVVRHHVDMARGGTSDLDVVMGDASRLTRLGVHLPSLDMDAVLLDMLHEHGVGAR